ncbi:hypothetical protein J5U18_13445 [Sphingobacteriaceae bacterium WQ 2009]|uniref:Uncharacterized protein n=1 Tax=Rhinopithecimicrobium faecis TaxID=2820698 RepID=A0A8T4HBQ5_9SPHI|nr:hypothetical protein [Sphingobacteriaceae bacterium WQ 2009]
MRIQQLIRKLNSTELNSQSTNDAYIRLSAEMQEELPKDFLESLNSKEVAVVIKKTSDVITEPKWIRYQFYPSNKEFRIVNLSTVFEEYNPTPGDYVIVEKIIIETEIRYEISMRVFEKLSVKFHKSKNCFEILNPTSSLFSNIEEDIVINFNGDSIDSKISFLKREKKRADSPVETSYYDILNLPKSFYDLIGKDSFIDITKRAGKYFISVEKSWEFNTIEK